MKDRFTVRIVQRWIPEYRVALLRGVGSRYPHRVEVWAAKEDMGVSCTVEGLKCDYTHNVVRIGSVQWQIGLSTKGLRRGDVIVVGGDVHNLSVLLLSLIARLKGIGVVWWGHHKTAGANPKKVKIRLWLARHLSDIYLCYTKSGGDFLLSQGFDRDCVYATGNTIDQKPIKAAIGQYNHVELSLFRKKHGISDQRIILTCGVIHKKMRLHQLIEALASSLLTNIDNNMLVVIGDGPEREDCQRLAERLGVSSRIIWVGAMRDQMLMAPWFLSANVFVYPGAIGLSIMHAFAYGLPVITHGCEDHQMPEFEVLKEGTNGLTFRENDIFDLAEKTSYLLERPSFAAAMGKAGQELVFNEYTMDMMVNNYSEAIESAHNRVTGN